MPQSTNIYRQKLVEEAEKRTENLVKSYETVEVIVDTLLSYKNSLRSINLRKTLNNGTRNSPNNLLQILRAPSTKESFQQAFAMLQAVIQDGSEIIMMLDVPNRNDRMDTLIEIVDELVDKAISNTKSLEVHVGWLVFMLMTWHLPPTRLSTLN